MLLICLTALVLHGYEPIDTDILLFHRANKLGGKT